MQKHERLEEDVKVALNKIIAHEIKHPNVEGIISITKVKITPDQKYAKVYLSVYNADGTKVVSALEKSASFIRRRLSVMVKLRNVPAITFELDNSIEYGAHINEVLKNLENNSED